MTNSSPPLPPFTAETAAQKVRLAEDAWNSRDPQKVSLAYTPDSKWRNRAEFASGRAEIVQFLQRKWTRELDYRLIKELWAFKDNRWSIHLFRCESILLKSHWVLVIMGQFIRPIIGFGVHAGDVDGITLD